MNYPSLPMAYSSTKTLGSDRQIERASNGTARGRVLFTGVKAKFQVHHENLNAAQMTQFRDFYSANLAVPFMLVWPATAVSYTCIFVSDPVETPLVGLGTNVSFDAEEV